MNPFRFGQVVSGEDFCERPELLKTLKRNIRAGQNTYLQGERRIGKSSLIKQAIVTSKGVRAIIVDLLGMRSLNELGREMVRGIVSMEKRGTLGEKALKLLSGFRPAVSYDSVTHSWSVSVSPATRFTDESVGDLMDVVERMAGGLKKLVVVFDEFQDVLKIDEKSRALAVLRSKIQHHTDIAYLFAGSIRSHMDDIFTHPDSPFFKSAAAMNVGPIEEGTFKSFLRGRFATGKRTIDDEALSEVFGIADSNPGDVQQICQALWDVTSYRDAIGVQHVPAALEIIFAQESKGYQATLNTVTDQQLRCLVGLAQVGGRHVTSQEFIEASGVRLPSSINKAFGRLEKTRVVFKKDGEYRFFNPFLGAWLLARRA